MGLVEPDSGKIVRGESVNFGYYSQNGIEVKENEKIIDSVKAVANYIKMSDGTEISASKMLERFLFTPQVQQNTISKLSGGEKKRLNLLKILMTNPNFLILDEPTNDFDIMTLNVVEDFLKEFKGCLIIISHDRYFMDKIVDHLFVFEGNAVIKDFPGNYSQYREVKEQEKEDQITTASRPYKINAYNEKPDEKSSEVKTESNKNSSILYKEISKLEKKREQLTERSGGNLSIDELKKISQEIKELNRVIEIKTEEWLSL